MAAGETNDGATEEAALAGIHDPLTESFPATFEGRLLFWLAVAFSAFQLATAAHLIDLASQIVQVVTDAITSPTITACTTMSADRNICHGER